MTRTRPFDLAFLTAATGGHAEGEPWGERVVTDTRDALALSLFVAIPGPRYDGHDFVAEAFAKGASGAVVSRAWRDAHPGSAGDLLVVDDTVRALGALARAHRERFPIPLAAVTGSNGKTTTKELLALALDPLGPVLKTSGNRNNHIGLPLTILELDAIHRAAVVEIGLNHPGELRHLAGIARPQVGVITNVAASHLEGLGSVDGVARAKAEIVAGLASDGVLVLPEASPPLERALSGWSGHRLTFGWSPRADIHPRRVIDRGPEGTDLELPDGTVLRVPLLGEHAARNALAAVAAAQVLGVTPRLAAPRMALVRPTPGRLAPATLGGVIVLDDTYNANPGSLIAALQVLRESFRGGHRWAILGDMLELGPEAVRLHRDFGAPAAFMDGLITVGELARELGQAAVEAGLDPARLHHAASGEDAARIAMSHLRPGDAILVKGSRGMHLETAVTALRSALEGAR